MDKRKGISLISLVITIIVILILTAAIIITTLTNSPIEEANEAAIKNDISLMQEEYELAKSESYIKNLGEESGIKNSDFVGVVPEKYKDDFKALKDEIIYVGEDEKLEKIAAEMGIYKKEYNIIEEVATKTDKASVEIETAIVPGETQ